MSAQTIMPFATAAGRDFLLAGNATLTAESAKTGKHYTFKVARAKPKPGESGVPQLWFVSLMTGTDNEADYSYLGLIRPPPLGGALRYEHGCKSSVSSLAPGARAVAWVVGNLLRGNDTPHCVVHHEGRCGRCGRTLTVPESIVSGYGPECVQKL